MPSTKDIPIIVLNLDRDIERLEHVKGQLSALNLQFQRFVATDKLTLTEADRKQYSPKLALLNCTRELSDGEIACSLSHIRIWQDIVENNYTLTLILEDDVILMPEIKEVILALQSRSRDYDLINFSTTAKQTTFGDKISNNHQLTTFKGSANMTSAYLLTLAGAKMLLKKAFPVRMPADAMTGRTHVTGIKAYGVFPEVAAIAGFESSIWEGDTVPRKRRFYKKLKKLLKVFFIKL